MSDSESILLRPPPAPQQWSRYGEHERQRIERHRLVEEATPLAFVHGGFWRSRWTFSGGLELIHSAGVG